MDGAEEREAMQVAEVVRQDLVLFLQPLLGQLDAQIHAWYGHSCERSTRSRSSTPCASSRSSGKLPPFGERARPLHVVVTVGHVYYVLTVNSTDVLIKTRPSVGLHGGGGDCSYSRPSRFLDRCRRA